jgi:hypothetical protein
MIFELKVYVKSRKSELLTTSNLKNRMEIHGYLNNHYGLKGWEGFEILRII